MLIADVEANWLFSWDDPFSMGPQLSMSTRRVRVKGKGFVVAHESANEIQPSVTLNSVASDKIIEPEIIMENRQLRQQAAAQRRMMQKEAM